MRRPKHDDSGAALVLALAFITVVSIGTTALITLADTGQRTTVAIRDQGYEVYAASGAIDAAVTAVRGSTSQGGDPATGGSCTPTSIVLNGVPTTVSCTGRPGSGTGGVGVVSPANSPSNAVLVLAARTGANAEPGLLQGSNNVLTVGGAVVSTSTVEAPAGVLNVLGAVRARGACGATVVATPVTDRACSLNNQPIVTAAGATMTSTDPDYPMAAGTPSRPRPPDNPPAGCAPGSTGARFVVFEPGSYSSAAEMNRIFTECASSVFWFKPGNYYFDFKDQGAGTSTVWNVTGKDTQLVGGTPARWSTPTPTAGGPRPTVPFPTAASPLGGCRTSAESPTVPGVQFAFGGTSRLSITGAKVELCATGSSSAQQIALYGVPAARDNTASASSTVVLYESGRIDAEPVSPTFQTPAGARRVDSAVSVLTSSATGNGDTSSLRFRDLDATSPVPPGSTIVDVRLRARYQPRDGVKDLSLTFTPGDGTAPVTIADAPDACGSSTTQLCLAPAGTPYDQRFTLPTALRRAAAVQGAELTFAATVASEKGKGKDAPDTPGTLEVDAVVLEVVYLEPSYRQQSGCATTVYDPGPLTPTGCATVLTRGTETGLSVHGTTYLPRGVLDVELTNDGAAVIDRGLIARSARVKVTASAVTTGPTIEVPALGGVGAGLRTVEFTASQVPAPGQPARPVLRAVVEFDDTVAGGATKVLSWAVLRQ